MADAPSQAPVITAPQTTEGPPVAAPSNPAVPTEEQIEVDRGDTDDDSAFGDRLVAIVHLAP